MKKILNQEHVNDFFQEHKEILEEVTPRILFEAIKNLQLEYDHIFLLSQINKIINAYYNSLLKNISRETKETCEQMDIIRKGNECINIIKNVIKMQTYKNDIVIDEFTNSVKQYLDMISHFSKETFPKLHQFDHLFSGISLLAMYHDEIAFSITKLTNHQKNCFNDIQWYNRKYSSILFQIHGSVLKLQHILCPILTEQISK